MFSFWKRLRKSKKVQQAEEVNSPIDSKDDLDTQSWGSFSPLNFLIDGLQLDNKQQKQQEELFKRIDLNIENYKNKILGIKSPINDGLKDIFRGSCSNNHINLCTSILENTALPPQVQRLLSQDRLISLILNTISNEASRDIPTIEVNFRLDENNKTFSNELANINKDLKSRLLDNNISSMLKDIVLTSKIYGVVNLLKKPKTVKSAEYWKLPFNIDSVTDNSVDFVFLSPEELSPALDFDSNDIFYKNKGLYDEIEYWRINNLFDESGQELVVHKSHLIRVMESKVYREDLLRYQYRGQSLVDKLAPICANIQELEKVRSHLIKLKGILVVKFPLDLVNKSLKANCNSISPVSYPTNYRFENVINNFSKLMDTSTARSKMIAVMEGMDVSNVDVALTDVHSNIESYYRTLSALSSLPVSTLGLTPPRGLNDTGAVEADGSRRAIESNQKNILTPALLGIIEVMLQETITALNLNNKILIDDLSFTIFFKANNAPTELEEAEVASKWIQSTASALDSGIITAEEGRQALQKAIPAMFDHLSLNSIDESDNELYKSYLDEINADEKADS